MSLSQATSHINGMEYASSLLIRMIFTMKCIISRKSNGQAEEKVCVVNVLIQDLVSYIKTCNYTEYIVNTLQYICFVFIYFCNCKT